MAAGATYTPIATTTLGSATPSYTFSSISGSYTDLVLVIAGTMAAGDAPSLRFNSDTGSNYSETWLRGNGSVAASARNSNITQIYIGEGNTGQFNSIVSIQNYSNATTYKTCLSRNNDAQQKVYARVGTWRSTAAITSVTITSDGSTNYSIGTTFTLYGIAAA